MLERMSKELKVSKSENGLIVGCLNICSGFNRKIPEIKNLLNKEKMDLFFIQETEIKDIDPQEPPRFDEYITICPKKNTKNKTRILLLIKDNLKMKIRDDLMCENISSIWVEIINPKKTKTVIGSLYREFDDLSEGKTGNSLSEQNKRFDIFLDQLQKAGEEKGTVLCLGDINLDSNKWDQESYDKKTMIRNLRNKLTMLNMKILNFGNTFMRIDQEGHITRSALDHAMINETKRVMEQRTIPCGFSDHDAIMVTIAMDRGKHNKDFKKIRARKIKNIRNNPEKFNRQLAKISWDKLINMHSVNKMVEFWNLEIKKVFDLMAPEVEKSSRPDKKIGLSQETKDQINIRDSLKTKIGTSDTNSNSALTSMYRAQRNLCNRLVKKDRERILTERLENSLDKAEVWKIVNEIRKPRKAGETLTIKVDNNPIDDEEKVANHFNNFFIEKIKGLTGKIDKQGAVDPTLKLREKLKNSNRNNHKFKLAPVTEEEIREIIQELKPKKSCGKDGMSAELLKMGATQLIPPLTTIINKSIEMEEFPTYWKEAIVKPLWKNKGEKDDMSNYRPVALLCLPGMVLERAVAKQLENHLERNNFFGDFQFGFRNSRSTQTAIATMCCKAQTENFKKKAVGMTMFDLSAAFDTVEKTTICRKLALLNVDNSTINWIFSYLSDRKQRVKIGGQISEPKIIPCGTPQGSRLSPLLFNIVTCDLNLYLTNGHVGNFADDTSNACAGNSIQRTIEILSQDANNMVTFASSNNLVINCDKTAFICNKKSEKQVTIGNQTIEASNSTRLLGMEISGDLTWKAHTEKLKKKLRQRLGILRRLKYSVPHAALKKIAEAIFTSLLRYGSAVYGKPKIKKEDPSNSTLKELTLLQNEMMRIITGKRRSDRASIESLRKATETDSVNHIIVYHILMESYNILCNGASATLKKLLTEALGTHRMTTRSSTLNKVNQQKNMGTKNDFLYYGSTLWNMIPADLRIVHQKMPDGAETPLPGSKAEKNLQSWRKGQFKKGIKTWIRNNIPSE